MKTIPVRPRLAAQGDVSCLAARGRDGTPTQALGRSLKGTPYAIIFTTGGSQPCASGLAPKAFDDPWQTAAASIAPLFGFVVGSTLESLCWSRGDLLNLAREPTIEDIETMGIGEFLETVYRLAKLGDLQGATDEVFETVDRLLLGGQFGVCNEILRCVDIHRLPTALMRSFLTITAAATDRMPARKPFYDRVESEMIRLKGKEKAQRILGQLA